MSFSSPLKFPSSAVPENFGPSLASERAARRWSQARLAIRAGLDRATVLRLEAGRRRPTPDTVFRLEAALDLEPRTLVPGWPEWSPIGLNTYGARSRERRRQLGFSLAATAAAAGVSIATLSRFEREIGQTSSLLDIISLPSGGIATLPCSPLSLALGFADRNAHADYCLRP